MSKENKEQIQPPEIGPFVFPSLLAIFGLWCSYDGWLSQSPGMQEHLMFNKIAGAILLLWSAVDFIRTWKIEKATCKEMKTKEPGKSNDT